jgi:hypothetical protein
MMLPQQYIDYINNGGLKYGFTSHEFGGYFALDDLDAIDEYNRLSEIGTYLPGYIIFGSDGGGEYFAFNKKGNVFLIPMIGMDVDSPIKIAESWNEYIKCIEK